jgi:hypothetical protein
MIVRSRHKFCIMQFDDGNHVKFVIHAFIVFTHKCYVFTMCINRMKYFHPLNFSSILGLTNGNVSSYLYVFHICFKHTTSMCKNYKHMKNKII